MQHTGTRGGSWSLVPGRGRLDVHANLRRPGSDLQRGQASRVREQVQGKIQRLDERHDLKGLGHPGRKGRRVSIERGAGPAGGASAG